MEVASCMLDDHVRDVLVGAVDAMQRAGAKVEHAHPFVSFDEQMALFLKLIGAAVSPSLPDEVAEERSMSHRAWLRLDEVRARARRFGSCRLSRSISARSPPTCTARMRTRRLLPSSNASKSSCATASSSETRRFNG